MKKILIFLFIGVSIYVIFFLYTEYKIRNTKHLIAIFSICNNLKVEKYKVYSTGDLYVDYLTDSQNFRELIGTYNYYEDIIYECHEDSIYADKIDHDEGKSQTLIYKKGYSLTSLKGALNYK